MTVFLNVSISDLRFDIKRHTLSSERGESFGELFCSSDDDVTGAGKVALKDADLSLKLAPLFPAGPLFVTATDWCLFETLLELLLRSARFIDKSEVSECTLTGRLRFINTRTKP